MFGAVDALSFERKVFPQFAKYISTNFKEHHKVAMALEVKKEQK